MWADQSGNGHDLVQAGEDEMPSRVAGALNSLPVIDSNGDASLWTDTDEIPPLTDGTIYMVGMQRGADPTGGVFVHAQDNFIINRNGSSDQVQGDGGTSGATVGPVNLTDGTFYSIRLRFTPTTMYLSVNNAAEVSAARGVVGLTASYLGLFNYGGTQGDKQIAELLVYTTSHNSTVRDAIENYLKTKYAHY